MIWIWHSTLAEGTSQRLGGIPPGISRNTDLRLSVGGFETIMPPAWIRTWGRAAGLVRSGHSRRKAEIMRRIQSAFLSIALSFCIAVTAAKPLFAQQKRAMQNRVQLKVCNKGNVPVEVVMVDVDADLREMLQGRVPSQYWRIDGQTIAPSAGCQQVYDDHPSLQPIFIGFGFKNSRGQFVSGHVPMVPDLGTNHYDSLTRCMTGMLLRCRTAAVSKS